MSEDFQKYPKHKYHAEHDAVIVADEKEEKELGAAWKDSPADHGVITAPSAEQARKLKLAELAKAEAAKKSTAK